MEPSMLILKPWMVFRSVFVTLMRKRIRIGITWRKKSRIRILINFIRILTNFSRIHNTVQFLYCSRCSVLLFSSCFCSCSVLFYCSLFQLFLLFPTPHSSAVLFIHCSFCSPIVCAYIIVTTYIYCILLGLLLVYIHIYREGAAWRLALIIL